MYNPQAHAAGVVRAVVDGHVKLPVDTCRAAVEEIRIRAERKEGIDQTRRVAPVAQNEAVVIDSPGQLVLQVLHELLREKGVVVDGGGLAEDVHLGVIDELFEKMLLTVRVSCAVEVGMRTAQAGLEHLEHVFIPGGHLIAVTVLDGHALNAGNVFFAVRAQNVDPAAKQPGSVVAADGSHKGLAPDFSHGVQNVPADGALCVAQHYRCALTPQSQKALGNDHGIVQPALAGTGSPNFQVPPV